ncbi:ABC transporter substrate-binding protein [Alkaliphilus peptidifermentans]|uniref:NitT/TauT family transport system substrate-binding protein n=1 Tax=Alkaliphilus peptidifermentans DSM 18978 TaxID=1120976 RepID=A0A1G5L1Y2_9FIRM|nr:ABC transporter substrate-binding protein [Alkaliphilus peptidifermentans]SCZ06441.1 NitT/TauT family transport system substrate-binding protein [Alkaliphilus peptidifermentans DSM 18978]
MMINTVLKKAVTLICITFFVLTISSCSLVKDSKTTDEATYNNDNGIIPVEKINFNVGALKGPTGMGMVELIDKSENGDSSLKYNFTLVGSPDDLVGKIINGEVDVAAIPTNLALLLYNRTEGKVQLVAVNTLGVLYILENGNSINTMDDLKGKTVYTSGKGASPDYIFQYIMRENNLIIDKDVILDYKLQHSELAAALVEGDVDIALLPQPHVTSAIMKNEKLRIALDITEEWNSVMSTNGELAMGCIIVQRKFAEENPDALRIFLDEYKQSVIFVNYEIDKAAELIEKYHILPNAAIAKRAIPYSNIVYLDAQEAKSFLQEYYKVLFDFDPKSVGGRLADEGFYYKKDQ